MEFNILKFFFDTPLYEEQKIDNADADLTDFDFIFNSGLVKKISFDGYNPIMKADSTFTTIKGIDVNSGHPVSIKTYGGFGTIILKCNRYDDNFLFYVKWNPRDKIIMKVGQYPSVADFHISEVKQYSKLLSEDKLKEFTRAIGLAANGVGIGSFVYLRRIFEYLIKEAYTQAKSENAVSESDFQTARMDEKIQLLHSYLPNFLVETKSMYSILSSGIHELSEQTCLEHFDTLRVGIEIILDEKLEALNKKIKIESAKNKLTALKGKIKSS